ncbi:MAG: DUF3048 domain-containing protein [Acidimicrobiales bacterium]
MPTQTQRFARRRAGVVMVAVSLVLAGCGAKRAASSRHSDPSSTSASSTSTTMPGPPVDPLTGQAPANPADLHRPALVVKIDNVDPARPQAGVDDADVVYEEEVESQLTRLMAVYQSADAAQVGPVRSTRTSDIDIVSALNRPLYAYSGGNTGFVQQLDAAPIADVGATTYGEPYYFMAGPHDSPHNLYARTADLFQLASKAGGPPPPLFNYRAAAAPATGAGAIPAAKVTLSFGMETSLWTWNASAQVWERTQDGTPDVMQDGTQLVAANVIVQMTPYTTDGVASGEGIDPPPPIPKALTVGAGTCTAFTGGDMIPCNWSKASATAVTQYTDLAGAPIQLAPGKTWVELAPIGTPVAVG